MKIDVMLMNEKEEDVTKISIGHNSVATLSYIVMFLLALVSVATGFALYADLSEWWVPKLFTWVTPLLGGEFMVRTIHHVVMWLFIFFAMVHVYLVFYHDWLEGRGEVSSMFGGYKFVTDERLKTAKGELEVSEEKESLVPSKE